MPNKVESVFSCSSFCSFLNFFLQSRIGHLEDQVDLILRLLTMKANATSASLPPRPESPTHPSPALPPPSTHSCLPFASAKHLLPPAPGNYLLGQGGNSLFNPEPIRPDKAGSSSSAGMHSDYRSSSILNPRQSMPSRNRLWSGPHCQGSGGTWAGLSEDAFVHPTVHFVTITPKKPR